MKLRYPGLRIVFGRARAKMRIETASKLELHEAEIRLLRRQTWASWATVLSTLLLSTALLTLTYCQWRTAESTAAIERAKAQPHFRIAQENQPDELGFLPRRFRVEADAGVSDAVHASATSIMEIIYQSRKLSLSGRCLASFPNFYGWTNDAMSFELNDAADRLMNFSRRPDQISESYIRMRPVWVRVSVDYLDIFGEAGRRDILLAQGLPAQLTPANLRRASQPEIELHLGIDPQGNVVLHRIDAGPMSDDCANALRVIARIRWLRFARPGEAPQDTPYPFAEPLANSAR